MKESDIEGVATHDGPEPCAGARKDVGEASAGGVQAGLLSREIPIVRGAHVVLMAEGNTAGGRKREPSADPARSENHGMYASSMRENRESPSPPAARSAAGRPGKAQP
jgi:hypothetical protein